MAVATTEKVAGCCPAMAVVARGCTTIAGAVPTETMLAGLVTVPAEFVATRS